MKKHKRILVTSFLTLVIITGGYKVFSEPGSERDPLVSKSYVDGKISELKSNIDSKLSISQETSQHPTDAPGDNRLEVINLKEGQSLIGGQGTEIILRSGRAVAIGSELGGISDVTAGKDIDTNEEIKLNHLNIVPRDDGRGIYSKGITYIMVRGKYRID